MRSEVWGIGVVRLVRLKFRRDTAWLFMVVGHLRR